MTSQKKGYKKIAGDAKRFLGCAFMIKLGKISRRFCFNLVYIKIELVKVRC